MSFLKWFAAPPRAVDLDAPALSLQVERQGNDLRVGWRRTAPAINSAKSAILLIHDGESQNQELALDPDQLRTGSVVYTPASSSIQFRLEVTGLDGKVVSETVLALTARKPGEVNVPSPVLPSPAVSSRPTGANRPSPFNTVPTKSEPKTFTPPARARDFGEPVRVLMVDPPAQSANAMPAGAGVPDQPVITQKPASSPPLESAAVQKLESAVQKPVATNPVAETPTTTARTTALPIVPAIPIHQAQPNVPANLRAMISSEIEVEVKVLINDAGRVLKAEPVPQRAPVSAFLIGAARNAALLWRFEPAKRGGQPVQSEMILKFRLRPAART